MKSVALDARDLVRSESSPPTVPIDAFATLISIFHFKTRSNMAAQTRIPRLLPQQQQPQQFGSGLGNSGGGQPAHDQRQQDPPRGLYQERPTDFLRAMQGAGIYRKHTLCLHCGKPATRVHRQNWRFCKDACPFDPSHLHDGALCPRLLQVANEEWCLSHSGSFMLAEREASRDPENA